MANVEAILDAAGLTNPKVREFVAQYAELTGAERIEVVNEHSYAPSEIVAMAQVAPGENIFRMDLEGGRRRLAAEVNIRDAALERVFPDTVRIRVFEREPLGGDALGTESYLFAGAVFIATLAVSAAGLMIYNRVCRKNEPPESDPVPELHPAGEWTEEDDSSDMDRRHSA